MTTTSQSTCHQLTCSPFDVSEACQKRSYLNSVDFPTFYFWAVGPSLCTNAILNWVICGLTSKDLSVIIFMFFFPCIFYFLFLCNSCMLVLIFQATVTCNSKHWVIGISTSLRGSQEEIWGLSCHSRESHSLRNHDPISTDGYLGLLLLLKDFPASWEHYFLTSMPIPAILSHVDPAMP